MTKFYNDLHDASINTDDIQALRELQIEINDAVSRASGFNDIDPEYDFHEVGYLPEGKNTRFTISEAAREVLLYRLAMLNKERHEAENANAEVVPIKGEVHDIKTYEKGPIRDHALDKVAESTPQMDIFGKDDE